MSSSPRTRRRQEVRCAATVSAVVLAAFWAGACVSLLAFPEIHSVSLEGSNAEELSDGDAAQQQQQQGQQQRPPKRLLLADLGCQPIAEAVQEATQGQKPVRMSEAQLLWLTAEIRGQAAACARPTRLLVSGYGLHAGVLAQAANCQGRTVFLESSLQQIDRIRRVHPFLEVHLVHYQEQLEADAFFQDPSSWLIDMPPDLGDTCFDVVLLNTSPSGVDAEGRPGRMQSSYLALEHARRCIAAGIVDDVVLLLHDSQMELEQRIVKQLFLAADPGDATTVRPLGTITHAALGDLSAFRVAPLAGGSTGGDGAGAGGSGDGTGAGGSADEAADAGGSAGEGEGADMGGSAGKGAALGIGGAGEGQESAADNSEGAAEKREGGAESRRLRRLSRAGGRA